MAGSRADGGGGAADRGWKTEPGSGPAALRAQALPCSDCGRMWKVQPGIPSRYVVLLRIPGMMPSSFSVAVGVWGPDGHSPAVWLRESHGSLRR